MGLPVMLLPCAPLSCLAEAEMDMALFVDDASRLPAGHARASARRNSRSSANRALTSIVPDSTFLLVMVCILAKGAGDCDITRIP